MSRSSLLLALLAWLLSAPWAAPAAAAEPGGWQLVERARRAADQGGHTLALEIYLKAVGRLGDFSQAERKALLGETYATCVHLIEQESIVPAVRGLIALLGPTRGDALAGDRVRVTLERTAMNLVLSGRSHHAVPALEALMAEGRAPALRWALLVRAYVDTRDFDKAASTLQRAFRIHPRAPSLFFARAALAGSQARLAVAQAAYARAESLLQKASADLEQAAAREPGMAGIQRALGKIRGSLWVYYRATGRYRRAIDLLGAAEEAYAEAARLAPRDPQPLYALGKLLFTAQDWIWAESCFRRAAARFEHLARDRRADRPMRDQALDDAAACRRFIASCYYHRAIDAANTAAFGPARRLIRTAARKVPTYERRADEVLAWLTARERAFRERVNDLQGDGGDAQVLLGDLWMRAHRFERARASYQKATAGALERFEPAQIEDRLFAVQDKPDQPRHEVFALGELMVQLDVPAGFDPGKLRGLLQKAHALTMSVFPHRLNGGLDLKVFPNRRAFLERAGPRVSATQGGFYVFGRVVTFESPGRSRDAWLTILRHEIAHRYIDEISYANAPRWLSEGLALHVSRRWDRRMRNRMRRYAARDRLFHWGELEERFARHWNDPAVLDILYLQSHHMVRWMSDAYDLHRVIILLALLRDDQPIEHAMMAAFGKRPEVLERRWRKALEER